ncbi:MAG: succinylglutamate desuccinylase/aspartoacylase family protein [Gammaproteobacteria bacterium]|nr:succinylglutamate desuccinylase/aspartoacylase family protein [Gammaproteobacteria bacterium]
MLNEMIHIPDALLNANVEELNNILGAPTLFHLNGTNKQPLFICTLLHGNETTGFYAIQRLLQKYRHKTLPRAVSLFIGNVAAAERNQRHLDTQDDYNRIWPGSHHNESADKDIMQTVTNIMQKNKPFASIDIHNNTGKNPHYACINNLNPHGLVLASKFSDVAVYFTTPKGVQSSAFSDFCPSVVLECGQSGDKSGVDHALQFLETVLQMEGLRPPEKSEITLYHTIARVIIPKTVVLSEQASSDGDIILNKKLEEKNFQQIQSGTEFATANSTKEKLLLVSNESDEDISNEYIERKNDHLVLKKTVTLAMFTTNTKAIRQDCVCYFMEELHIG